MAVLFLPELKEINIDLRFTILIRVAAGVDLQISGHTHAGQLWPFDYAIRLDQPAVQGLSRHGDTQLYVTAGAGYWGPPMRIGARPEVTVVELRAPS